ncbi:hypothetical protein GYMLUDRAFT_746883 [Collybiopsis luxurians FD-317 M1]|uniref:SAP domain-containing protein n=1 Tax=Collybiopsis luxurians FD-317 M1 TaxID=944289 RepID=A0A0D0B3C0_9AGAR|nr:hypothetical protein GYMLUDRAFT_746883 [Collybiopsis luxurians FD-317 M1]
MLRAFSSPAIRSLTAPRRSFVSAILLSQSWDKFTVQDLKKEARKRGLSPTGNKNILISRIQEHEKSLSSVAAAAGTNVSTPPQTPSVDATKEGETPGIPLASQAAAPTPYYLNISLPDAAYDQPEPPVQIPYTLDFWKSSASAPTESHLEEPTTPKMVVIGGEETYGGASPTHNLLDETQMSLHSPTSVMPSTVERGKGGLLDDMAEDMGLPHARDLKNTIFKLFG